MRGSASTPVSCSAERQFFHFLVKSCLPGLDWLVGTAEQVSLRLDWNVLVDLSLLKSSQERMLHE